MDLDISNAEKFQEFMLLSISEPMQMQPMHSINKDFTNHTVGCFNRNIFTSNYVKIVGITYFKANKLCTLVF